MGRFEKYKLVGVGRKVMHHTRAVTKKSAAICFLMVLVVGTLIPLALGFVMTKSDDFAVTTMVASSTDTNSSIIIGKWTNDGNFANMDGWDWVSSGSNILSFSYVINKSALNENVDKIVVKLDPNGINISKYDFKVVLIRPDGEWIRTYNFEYDNKTGLYVVEIPVTPDIVLSPGSTVRVSTEIKNLEQGKVFGERIEAYDVKGISAEKMTNILLGVSGVLLLLGGICATPYVNPTKWYNSWFNSMRRRRR